MANEPDYRCTSCKEPTDRKLLTVKKVQFLGMGAGAKTLRTRVDSWLCPQCVVKDKHWNQVPSSGRGPSVPAQSPLLTPDRHGASMIPSAEDRT